MNRRHLLLSLPALALTACAPVPNGFSMPPNTTLIVVRHSDRLRGEAELSELGRARSIALVDAVAEFDLAAIYAPGIQRNLDTAAPLVAARGIEVERIAQEAPTGPILRGGAGKTVIWIGNQGNIRTIWSDLSLPEPIPLEYGDLAIVRSDAQGTVTIEMRRFGPSV